MNKRFIALILSLLMAFSVLSIPTFANHYGFQDEYEYTTNDYITDEQIFILNKLGISRNWSNISEMGSRHDEPLTRHFMAWYTVLIAKLNVEYPSNYETLFKDLSSEHEYYAEMKAVVKAGYMNGDGNGYFRPNDLITTKEAATVLLRVLGYSPYIEALGVDKILLRTNILDGIEPEGTVTQAKFLRMVFNALNSPALKSTSYKLLEDGNTDIEYVIDETYLGFEHLYGIKHEIGIVDALVGTTLIDSSSDLKDGQIGISGITYEYNGDASAFFGYKVNYFYRDKGEVGRELIYMHKSDKNQELVLTHDVLDGFSDGVYSYEQNNSTKRIALSNDTRVIYNGAANPNFIPSEMVPDFGSVTLINNDSDRDYDVVKIESYKFFISSRIDTTNLKIYTNTYKVADLINLREYDQYQFFMDEEEIGIEKLRNGNLLAVRFPSENAKHRKISIDAAKVTKSKVEVVSIKEDTFVAGKDTYTLWNKLDDYATIKLGTIYNLYVFRDQVVAVVEGDISGMENAYLINFGVSDEAFGNSAKAAVVDMAGNYLVYDVAEKVVLDGTALTNMNTAKTRLLASAQQSARIAALASKALEDTAPVAQPIMIGFNKNGEINKIDTYYYDSSKEDASSLQQLGAIYDDGTGAVLLKDTSVTYSNLNNSLYYTSTTPETHVALFPTNVEILSVPATDIFNKDKYTTGALQNEKSYYIDLSNFDADSDTPQAAFAYSLDDGYDRYWSGGYMVVAELYEELNEDGEVDYVVKAYKKGELIKYTADKELFALINVGDLWSFSADKYNHIELADNPKATHNLFSMSLPLIPDTADGRAATYTMTTITPGAPSRYSMLSGYVIGTVMRSESGFGKIAVTAIPTDANFEADAENDSLICDYFNISNAAIFKYSENKGVPELTKSSAAELVSYAQDRNNPSVVLISAHRETVNQVIIIEQ